MATFNHYSNTGVATAHIYHQLLFPIILSHLSFMFQNIKCFKMQMTFLLLFVTFVSAQNVVVYIDNCHVYVRASFVGLCL